MFAQKILELRECGGRIGSTQTERGEPSGGVGMARGEGESLASANGGEKSRGKTIDVEVLAPGSMTKPASSMPSARTRSRIYWPKRSLPMAAATRTDTPKRVSAIAVLKLLPPGPSTTWSSGWLVPDGAR